MVLFLHNRYRTTGGEERVVKDLLALVRERLDDQAQLLERDSATLGGARAAAGLLRGGLQPQDVARAVRLTGARVVHAHNLNPAFGWRALAAARAAGARVVLHLHQYRLVCAIGVCFTRGEECTRCHGRDTLPGVRLNCRGSRAQALAYGASLALWQRRLAEQADAVIVPSAFARERLRELGAPLDWGRVHVLAPPVGEVVDIDALMDAPPPASGAEDATWIDALATGAAAVDVPHGGYALVVSRLAAEKGIDVAIDACGSAGIGLVVAGDGPELDALRAHAARAGLRVLAPEAERAPGRAPGAAPGEVRFVGRVDDTALARLRTGAAIALAPSRAAETFGLAVAESLAAAVPVAGSRAGALTELIDARGLVPPGDADALARAIADLAGDRAAGERGRERVRALCAPDTVAATLSAIYDAVR